MDIKGIEIIKELLAEVIKNIGGLSCEHPVDGCVLCVWERLREKTEDYLSSLEKQKITIIEAWDKIIGNEYLKRAIEISLTGQHPITVIGDPDNGEEYLKIILGDLLTFIKPCPCGNFMNPSKACTCTLSQITKYRTSKEYQKALNNSIIVKLVSPTSYDYRTKNKSESFKDILNRIEKVDPNKKLNIDTEAIDVLNSAIQTLRPTTKQVENIHSISNTIALLDGMDVRKIYHIFEAIQYQNIDHF